MTIETTNTRTRRTAKMADPLTAAREELATAERRQRERRSELEAARIVKAEAASAEDRSRLEAAIVEERANEALLDAATQRLAAASAEVQRLEREAAHAKIARRRGGAGAAGFAVLAEPIRDRIRSSAAALICAVAELEAAAADANSEQRALADTARRHGLPFSDAPATLRAADEIGGAIESAWIEGGARADIAAALGGLARAAESHALGVMTRAIAAQDALIDEYAATLPLERYEQRAQRAAAADADFGRRSGRWEERAELVRRHQERERLKHARTLFMSEDKRAQRWATAEVHAAITARSRDLAISYDAAASRYFHEHPGLGAPEDLTHRRTA